MECPVGTLRSRHFRARRLPSSPCAIMPGGWVSRRGRKSDMPTPTRHFKEELQDWLDGRLDAATCDQVERHLAWCDECRREYESVGWVKHIAAQQSGSVAAPAELRAKVLRALRAEMPAVNVVTPPLDFWTVRRRAAHGHAHPGRRLFPPPRAAAGSDGAGFSELPVGAASTSARHGGREAMETFFTAQGVAFPTRIFDLGMMNYRLAGGRVQSLRGRPNAAFAYAVRTTRACSARCTSAR